MDVTGRIVLSVHSQDTLDNLDKLSDISKWCILRPRSYIINGINSSVDKVYHAGLFPIIDLSYIDSYKSMRETIIKIIHEEKIDAPIIVHMANGSAVVGGLASYISKNMNDDSVIRLIGNIDFTSILTSSVNGDRFIYPDLSSAEHAGAYNIAKTTIGAMIGRVDITRMIREDVRYMGALLSTQTTDDKDPNSLAPTMNVEYAINNGATAVVIEIDQLSSPDIQGYCRQIADRITKCVPWTQPF